MAWVPIQAQNLGEANTRRQSILGSAMQGGAQGYKQGLDIADQREEQERRRAMRDAAKEADRSVTEQVGQGQAMAALEDARRRVPTVDSAHDEPSMSVASATARDASYAQAKQAMRASPQQAGYTVGGQGDVYGSRDEAWGQTYSAALRGKGLGAEAFDAQGKAQTLALGKYQIGDARRKDALAQQLSALSTEAEEVQREFAEQLAGIGSSGKDVVGTIRDLALWTEGKPGIPTISFDAARGEALILKDGNVIERVPVAKLTSQSLLAYMQERGPGAINDYYMNRAAALQGDFKGIAEIGDRRRGLGIQQDNADSARISAGAAASNAATAKLALGELKALGDPFQMKDGSWMQEVTDRQGKRQTIPAADPQLAKGTGGTANEYNTAKVMGQVPGTRIPIYQLGDKQWIHDVDPKTGEVIRKQYYGPIDGTEKISGIQNRAAVGAVGEQAKNGDVPLAAIPLTTHMAVTDIAANTPALPPKAAHGGGRGTPNPKTVVETSKTPFARQNTRGGMGLEVWDPTRQKFVDAVEWDRRATVQARDLEYRSK